jgi:NAD(P) transhydrogenase
MRTDFYIPIYKGRASFLDNNTIKLVGKRKKLSAMSFVIATGSSPYHPPGVDFSHERVFDSDTILNMDCSPRKVTIMGAGVIGCEYASIFGGLGCKVELINPASGLLTFLDTEIADALSYHLRNLGVRSRHNEEFEKMECSDDRIVTYLKSGKKIRSDIVLTTNSRHQISVNRQYQTSVEIFMLRVMLLVGPYSQVQPMIRGGLRAMRLRRQKSVITLSRLQREFIRFRR